MFAQNVQLFNHIDTPRTEWAGKQVADLRQAEIQVHKPVLIQIRDGQISEFSITGFNGVEYSIEVRRIIQQLDGDWSVIGWINGNWKDSFILSYSNNEVLSTIREVTNHNFMEIRFDSELNNHLIIEIDPHERDELECGQDHELIAPDDETQKLKQEHFEPPSESPAIVDVMIVYTPSAETWAISNSRGIRNVINQAMAIAQNSVDNSRINLVFRLVHYARVNYSESDNTYTDLRNLTFGRISNVHSWRDQYGADLVAMFTKVEDVGGLGWLPVSSSGNSAYGYSITRVQQADWTSTHAHEMGHNFGNHHSRNQRSNPAPSSGGVFSYSTGWRWTGTDGRSYASVMTYGESSTMVDIFSNPDVTYAGTPSGSYTGTGAPADNARSMNNMKGVISSYRATTVVTNPPIALAASNVETRSFTANWEVADRASGYLLDLSNETSFESFVQGYDNRSTGNVTSYLISDAAPGTDYHYRVRAEFDGLVSANSTVITVTTFPDIPIALSASERNALEFTATWQPADGARWYEVDVAEDMLFETILTDYENIEVKQGTSLTVAGLEPGRDYFYRIRSVAGIRRSEYSEVAQTSTLSISAENSTIAQNQLRILANGLQTNPVQVEVKSEEGVLLRNLRVKLEADSGSPIIEEIQPVTDENGIAHFALTSAEISKVTFNVIAHNTTVGNFTVEFLANEGILALGNNYPNPFNGKTILPVTVPRQMMIRIIVYDTLGKPIMNVIREELETGYYEIPVSAYGLASGLYFYRLYTEDKILIDSMTLIR